MSEIIVPENGTPDNGKKTEEKILLQVIFKEGQLIPYIGDGVQLRDISHALRILNLMLDVRISQAQVKNNIGKIQPAHGIIDNLRRGFRH